MLIHFYADNNKNNSVKIKILGQMLSLIHAGPIDRFVLDELEWYPTPVPVPSHQTLRITKGVPEVKIRRYVLNWLILFSHGCSLGVFSILKCNFFWMMRP